LAVYSQDSVRLGTPDYPVGHRTVSGRAPDSVQCARLNTGEQAALGRSRRRTTIIHRTVRCAPDCLVSQRSAGATVGRVIRAWPSQRSNGDTGLSSVHRTVSGAPTAPRLQRSTAPFLEGNQAPDSVRWCIGLSGAPPD
jgi:hypothetical protein